MEITGKKIKRVAFFGDAEVTESSEVFKQACETAELLARNGYIVVDGGGPGVMWAATKGAKKAGGEVEIVVLNPNNQPNNYEGVLEENLKSADKVVVVKSYSERVNKLMEIADAFVIFKGGTGTLSEVGLTWEMAKFDYGYHEPLIFVGDEWKEIVRIITEKMNYEDKEKEVVTTVMEPRQVLEKLKAVAGN